MNALDIVLLIAIVSFAVSGYRQGFIVGMLSFAGFLGGGALAMYAWPRFVDATLPGAGQSLLAIVAVLVGALLGQVLASYLGTRMREVVTAPSARALDAAGGAVVSVIAVLLVAYILGLAIVQSPLSGVARQVRTSSVLGVVSQVVPETASGLFSGFQNILDSSGFPRVFSGLQEPTLPVEAPDPAVLQSPAVAESRDSIVKVLGAAPSCRRQVEGTGFVYAPERVMTNAHVVAGVDEPNVAVGDGAEVLGARVVAFDPGRDVAVLLVPGLDAEPLGFASASRGDEAVVAGYPESGPFTAVPARVRGETRARGNDIYNSGTVVREIYSLFATVRPGNSGGPLLALDGSVYGVIFAASVDDASTGYALTADEVAPVAAAAASASGEIDTGACV
jgi:S1-C subfamily serine protease